MGLGYVGYIWSILGCSFLALFVGGLAVALYAIGKRAERGRPRTFAESLSIVDRAGGARTGGARTSSDRTSTDGIRSDLTAAGAPPAPKLPDDAA